MLEENTKFHMQPTNLFATPEDLDALMSYIMRFNGGERHAAMICAMKAWNLGCKVQRHNEELVDVQTKVLHSGLNIEDKNVSKVIDALRGEEK